MLIIFLKFFLVLEIGFLIFDFFKIFFVSLVFSVEVLFVICKFFFLIKLIFGLYKFILYFILGCGWVCLIFFKNLLFFKLYIRYFFILFVW